MQSSPLQPLHERAGARTASGGGHPLVLTYGDVPAEYAAALEGCVVFDATAGGSVRATGAERAAFLHRILANRVRELGAGEGNRNLLLTPKGKVLFDFDLEVDEGEIRLSTPPDSAAGLVEAIDHYLFAEDVELADASDEAAPLELVGPRANGVLEGLFGSAPQLGAGSWTRLERGGPVRVTRVVVAGSPGYRLDAGPDGAAALWSAALAAGARPSGVAVRDILRVEACHALFGVDVDENVYPQEARLETSFSLDKGCYVGQEVVAKIDTYGGLNKRLMALRVDHDDPVPRGTELLADGRSLGLVTSWAYSFALDTGLCLAYVKRRHQEPGSFFELSGGRGRAEIVPTPVRPGTASD